MVTHASPTEGRHAVILGGTGLVGRELVSQLDADPSYTSITLLVRREIDFAHGKIDFKIVDFDQPQTWRAQVRGAVLFSCMGTTLKVAGSKEAQFRIDHDYQLWAAQAAKENGVAHYVPISSMGASSSSMVFYSKMKGQLEEAVTKLGFESCNILRPGILDGDRKENRPGEKIALGVLRKVPNWVLPQSARPSPVTAVARACIEADREARPGVRFIEAREISHLG